MRQQMMFHQHMMQQQMAMNGWNLQGMNKPFTPKPNFTQQLQKQRKADEEAILDEIRGTVAAVNQDQVPPATMPIAPSHVASILQRGVKKIGMPSLAVSAMLSAKQKLASTKAPAQTAKREPAEKEEPRSKTGLQLFGELAPQGLAWTYVLQDEARRSFAGFLPNALPADMCSAYFEKVEHGVDWQQPKGPYGPVPRKTAWMVAGDCTCKYRYGGIEVPPQVFPPWMLSLLEWVMPVCGLSKRSEWPNACNLNLYRDGGMSVGWHADDEALFQGKFNDCRIISVSFGVKRRFELRPNCPVVGDKLIVPMDLGDGDLCTMEGMTQKHFQHRVPKQNNICGPRINLTWRWVMKHNASCPVSRSRCDLPDGTAVL